MVYLVSGGDITKTEYVFNMKAVDFLFWVCYLTDKQAIEAARYEKMNKS